MHCLKPPPHPCDFPVAGSISPSIAQRRDKLFSEDRVLVTLFCPNCNETKATFATRVVPKECYCPRCGSNLRQDIQS
jgi:hypothetical protein